MSTVKHIADLLKSYNCVIVPEFGGFVANYQPSRIHPTQHTIQPPTKLIAFNKNLTSNDGLLTSHIAKSENITFEKAELKIKKFIADCETVLKKEEVIILPQIGKLFYDIEHNLQFSRDRTTNHLLQSFGMSTVQFPPIIRTTDSVEKAKKHRLHKEPVSSSKLVSITSANKNKHNIGAKTTGNRFHFNYYVAAIILLVVIFIFQWEHNNMSLVNYRNSKIFDSSFVSQIKNMFTFNEQISEQNTSSDEAISKETASVMEVDAPAVTNEEELMDIVPDNLSQYEEGGKGKEEEIKEANMNQPVEDVIDESDVIQPSIKKENKAAFKTAPSLKGHYIILGAFKEKSNANKLLLKLKDQGVTGKLLSGTKGFVRIGIGPFSTKSDAKIDIIKFRISYPDAWVLEV